jgi:hypothetical protein
MRLSLRAVLAVALAGSLLVVFIRSPTDVVGPQPAPDGAPEAWARATGYPDIVPLRWQAKDVVAQEVIAGRRPLLAAAALFGELDRLPPEPADPWGQAGAADAPHIPGRTPAERLCRSVIAHVRAALRHEPPAVADAAVARASAEFFKELRAHGAIRLPDPATLEPVAELLARTRATLTDVQQKALSGHRGAGR